MRTILIFLLLTFTAFSQTVLPGFVQEDSLRGWWIFDNVSHAALGHVDTTDIATIWDGDPNVTTNPILQRYGSPTLTQNSTNYPGGYSAVLDGNDAYSLGRNPFFTADMSAGMTIHAWVKGNGDPLATVTFVRAEDGTTNRSFFLGVHSSDVVRFYIFIGNTTYTVNSTTSGATLYSTYFNNAWHLFTGVHNGTDLRLYIDGVLNCTPTAASGALDTDNVITGIGYNATASTAFFVGSIEEVKLYNRAWSAAEVLDYYTNYTRLVPSAASTDTKPGFPGFKRSSGWKTF